MKSGKTKPAARRDLTMTSLNRLYHLALRPKRGPRGTEVPADLLSCLLLPLRSSTIIKMAIPAKHAANAASSDRKSVVWERV